MDISCGKTFLYQYFDPMTLTLNLLYKNLTLALTFEPKEILRDYKSRGGVLVPLGQPRSSLTYMCIFIYCLFFLNTWSH